MQPLREVLGVALAPEAVKLPRGLPLCATVPLPQALPLAVTVLTTLREGDTEGHSGNGYEPFRPEIRPESGRKSGRESGRKSGREFRNPAENPPGPGRGPRTERPGAVEPAPQDHWSKFDRWSKYVWSKCVWAARGVLHGAGGAAAGRVHGQPPPPDPRAPGPFWTAAVKCQTNGQMVEYMISAPDRTSAPLSKANGMGAGPARRLRFRRPAVSACLFDPGPNVRG